MKEKTKVGEFEVEKNIKSLPITLDGSSYCDSKMDKNCCCINSELDKNRSDNKLNSCKDSKLNNSCCNNVTKSMMNNHKSQSNKEECACSCCDISADYASGKKDKKISKDVVKKLAILIVSLAFLIAGFFNWKDISNGKGFLLAFYYVNPAWISIILCGIPIYIKGFKSLKRKKLTAAVLISIAMTASIVLEITSFFISADFAVHNRSYIFAAGEIAFLMAVGGALEELTVKKCRSGIERLVSLIPTEANLIVDGGVKKLKLENLNIGDKVIIKAGEMVAVDGIIVKGFASIDQASLTGESLPVDKNIGDNVFGGTLNKNGVIEVEVQKLKKDMTIAKMAELTIEAEGKKAPISRVADKWVSVIVPTVLLTSLIVGLIAGFAMKIGTMPSIVRAITILVVFCPCSLVLATPTAIAAGLGNAAKNGVLVKSGATLEELSRVNTVCFDKTGTITTGNIELKKMNVYNYDENEFFKIVASVEKYSEHPLAVAVVKAYESKFSDVEYIEYVEYVDVDNIEIKQGVGLSAKVDGKIVSIMSYNHAFQNKIVLDNIEKVCKEFMNVGNTVAVITIDNSVCGIMAFADTIRNNASEVVEKLNEKKYETIMLTGDNENSASNIASLCNIQKFEHNLLPSDKLDMIEKMQKDGKTVAMIGDGINDAPSLKLANCSFAMGAMGSDIAIDSADMAILNSDIEKVYDSLKLGKRVMRTIKRNITVAMTINVISVLLSLFGYLTPVTGALVHNMTSLIVVVSSALILFNPNKSKRKSIRKLKKC